MLGESRNEIHRDLLKGESAFFCCDAVEGYPLLVSQDFVLLAYCASFYIVRYPLTHPHPWQGFGCSPNCFILPRVSCHRMVVDKGHKVPFGRLRELCHVGGIDEEFWFEEGLVSVVVISLV